MNNAAINGNSKHPIKVRRPTFDFASEKRRNWCRSKIFYTMVFNAFSIVLPYVEKFTVSVLRETIDDINDPNLKNRAKAMLAQEAIHGKQHEHSMEVLENNSFEQGFIHKFCTFLMSTIMPLTVIWGRYGRHIRVAGIVGGEHWTTIISRWALKSRAFRLADGPMTNMYLWHSIEELEHKSVAYDVLQDIQANFFIKSFGFILASVYFFMISMVSVFSMMLQLRIKDIINPFLYIEIFAFLFLWPAALLRFMWGFFEFFMPGFHPDNVNDDELIAYGVRELKRREVNIED